MEDYDDVREALKLVPGGDVGWQVTQTRLAVSLLTALVQSLDRRLCEAEREANMPTEQTLPTAGQPDDWAWKTKAVTVIVWGTLALLGAGIVEAAVHFAELKLHMG